MQVTWRDTDLELDEENPVHRVFITLNTSRENAVQFRGRLEQLGQDTEVRRARLYADGKIAGLDNALNEFLSAL